MPRSLLGQVLLVLALGLSAAQLISGALLFRAAEERREVALANALAFRFVAAEGGEMRFDRRFRRGGFREDALSPFSGGERGDRPNRRFRRIEESDASPLRAGERRDQDLEKRLSKILADQGIGSSDLVVVRRQFERAERRDLKLVVAGRKTDAGQWTIVRLPEPRRPKAVLGTILTQTLVIFVVLFTLLFFVLRRLTRPLANLTERVADFAQNPDRAVMIEESGPADMRRLIAAHNAMETRISAMLDEKDVMLGAIGHDLKTPLAALRVRIESVPDDAQRARMADSIEDITRTLDDILNLARVGRASDPKEPTDLAALVVSLVEEYEDMDDPVILRHHEKVVAPLRATWLRRAVRNLIGNALRYGKTAAVDVAREDGMAVIRIDDEGPGIPADQIAAMMEPFQRGEASRNRATGGSGLGLTLARAIAEQHGGTLRLTNRPEGGLRAEIRLPL